MGGSKSTAPDLVRAVDEGDSASAQEQSACVCDVIPHVAAEDEKSQVGEAAGEADQRLALADPQPLSRAPSHGLGVGTAVRVSPRITGRSQGQGAEPLCELDVLGDLGEVLVDPGVDRVEALRGAVGDERRSRFLEEVRILTPRASAM